MIAKAFKDANLKLGVTTRPRDMCVRKDWKQDLTIDINPDDPGHRAMIWNRFKNMTDKGCTLSMRNRIIPLVPGNDGPKRAPDLKKYRAEFLDEKGRWRD